MTDRVVIYTPLEDILYNQGGFMIVIAVIVAGLIGAGVYALIERTFGRRFGGYRVRAWGTSKINVGGGIGGLISKYNGWISIAAALGALYLIHLANVKGLI
jgi:hypothetical protein